MKNIRIALWAVLLGLTGLWLLADTLWPQPFHYFTFRSVAVQWTGVLAIGAMSVILVLAARPAWAERWLDGLDKSYRLHKWLGIAALAASVAHWWLALGTKWMVGWGWLVRPERGPRPKVTDPVQLWFNSQKGLADTLGEWAFYGGAALIVLALIKRFPYRWFAKTHTLLAVAYLALVYHSVIRTRFAYWAQPVGWVEAALMLVGSVAALMVLAGRVGAKRRVQATVQAADWLAPMQTLRMRLAAPPVWAGHAPGQFAFVSFSRAEGAHPYTIASAWDGQRREITFLVKALGDYTSRLHEWLRPGQRATLEGPYGCFTFEDGASAQIWVGAGIGITPFMARMEHLARLRDAGDAAGSAGDAGDAKGAQNIRLFYCVQQPDAAFTGELQALAARAGVTLHVIASQSEGRLTARRLRERAPEWATASVWFCGPTAFGQALQRELTAAGLPAGRFHQELFEMR